VHLSARLPFSPNGSEAGATRDDLISTAVSLLYAPNADNTVCTLRFRDGKDRTVAARELCSGRLIASVCQAARRHAFQRDVREGDRGLRRVDIERAVADAVQSLRATLSPANVHAFLDDLPHDRAVVAVEPFKRPVQRTHRYLNP
jgi:hypothetical protein